MIVVVESLAKQISVTNRAPYSVRGKRRVASMTVNIPGSSVAEIKLNVVELKLDRLIDALPKINHDRIRIRACVGSRRISNRANDSPKANLRRGSRRQGQLCLQSGQRSVRP
jgi:hypothetical protein